MMKTKKSFVCLLLIFSFSMILFSCGKDDLTGTGNVSSANTTGGIMDLGIVEGNVRRMHVSLTSVAISVNDAPNGTAATNRLNIYLHSESDGIIKDGTYHFSGSRNVSPFIFETALVSILNKVTGNSDTFDVKGGTIVVARSNAYYTINMNGTLSNGNTIRAAWGGSLSYSD